MVATPVEGLRRKWGQCNVHQEGIWMVRFTVQKIYGLQVLPGYEDFFSLCMQDQDYLRNFLLSMEIPNIMSFFVSSMSS